MNAARRLPSAPAVPVIVVLVLLLGVPMPPACAAEEVPAAARTAFLRDRDAGALLRALDEAGVPAGDGWRGLAWLAADRMPPAALPEATGVAALTVSVLALRRLDLAGAQQALRRAGDAAGRAGAWMQALLHLRRGDDAGAVGALLAPPVFDPVRDAFPLALLGAALDPDDRLLLAAGARIALERAASRGRVPALRGAALGAAMLEPEGAAHTLAFAVRVLRRMGEVDEAAALVRAAPPAGVQLEETPLAFEAALMAWEAGRADAVPAWLAGTAPDGCASAWLALRRGGGRPRTHIPKASWRHEPSLRAHAAATARLATALGRPTSAAEIASWARRARRETWHADTARAFLEAQGFEVLALAGDAQAGDLLLRAGLPFLLYRLAPDGRGWRETPAVVHGHDHRTGLWLLDVPDGRHLDVMPHADAGKARILAAAPLGRRSALAAVRGRPTVRRGALLEQALARADRGEVEAAVADVARAATDGDPITGLVLAHLRTRLVAPDEDGAELTTAAAAAERSRRTPPMVGLEAYLLGVRESARGNVDAALSSLRAALRLEGPTVTVLLAMFSAQLAAGRQAEALATLGRARAVDPTDVAVLFHRGTVRAATGETVLARRDLQRALERRPTSIAVAVALARLHVREGRYGIAIEVLQSVQRRDADLAADPILQKARRTVELEWIRGAEAVADLRGMRRSASPETRRMLAYELARRSAEPEAAEGELREILGDPDEQVRVTALQVYLQPWLRRRIEEDAVLARRIGRALAEDAAARVRAAAAAVLARVPTDQAGRLLTAALTGPAADADASVRAAAARGLANHDGPGAYTALVAALEDGAVDVRKAAGGSLFRLTGTDRGFVASAPAAARAEAVAAWQTWLAER